MAHFAELDTNNTVIRVIVINNNVCKDQFNNENETIGALFCHNLFGGIWKQTSYNNNIRKQFASIGFVYDPINDVFIAPQPYPSWILNDNYDWVAPVEYPEKGNNNAYKWDEEKLSWIEVK